MTTKTSLPTVFHPLDNTCTIPSPALKQHSFQVAKTRLGGGCSTVAEHWFSLHNHWVGQPELSQQKQKQETNIYNVYNHNRRLLNYQPKLGCPVYNLFLKFSYKS